MTEPERSALLRAVDITDRLRSPGGCPWDAQQTHSSLSPYLLEEAYETLDAIQSGDLVSLREELGDLLFQVLFHARLAEEADPEHRFSISEVAADLVDKLTRRHPHVFADASVTGAAEVEANWEAIKRAEKARSSATDGVPTGQPALSLTAALLARAGKAGLQVDMPAGAGVGERLFALVRQANADGVDAELALRQVALNYAEAIRAAEGALKSGAEPGAG